MLMLESNIQTNNLKSVYESFARVSVTAQFNETALESNLPGFRALLCDRILSGVGLPCLYGGAKIL